MNIWFIDEENTGSTLLSELEPSDLQSNRYYVFSRKVCVKKWAGHFPLHVQLFDA